MEKTPIDRVLAEMAAQNMSDAEFCRRLHTSPQTLTNWKKRGLPGAKAPAVADVLGVTADWILTGREPKHPIRVVEITETDANYRRVPVISYEQAGVVREIPGNHAVADRLETVGLDFDLAQQLSARAFALVVMGDSMLPEFRQGDIVIIDPGASVRPGDIVAANFNNKPAILRRYRDRGEDANGSPVFELVPMNDAYPILIVDSSRQGHIIGPVIEHRKKYR